ncbi:hypothetical protein EDB19DRAFT_1904403 [Suillus lakei]|nr:hypothetical protein EDB19DRAFT_1904403 [Suillus lakei]
MNALQGIQPGALLWFNYGYVALTALWVYDHVLCMPDSASGIGSNIQESPEL